MGVRGIVRDLISFYLGYEIIRGHITGNFAMTNISVAVIALVVIAIWFMLERIGLLPKI